MRQATKGPSSDGLAPRAAGGVRAPGVCRLAYVWHARHTAALTDRDSIVIGAFENTTGNAVFDETLVTALKVQLGQSPFLDIVPDRASARR